MNRREHISELIAQGAVLPGPTLLTRGLAIGEMLLGALILVLAIPLGFYGFALAVFGQAAWCFYGGIVLGIAFIIGGLRLVVDGEKRFKRRRQQPDGTQESAPSASP
jgi:hypothetical protein